MARSGSFTIRTVFCRRCPSRTCICSTRATTTASTEKLGAHVREHGGVKGVSFAVWAPSARRVSVVGDFNHWDGRYHPMRSLGASGVWEIFIPGLEPGAKYKFEIVHRRRQPAAEDGPVRDCISSRRRTTRRSCATRAVTQWNDGAWLERRRAQTDWERAPVVDLRGAPGLVEAQAGGRQPPAHLPRDCAPELAAYVKEMGFTHIEVMPLAEHPFDGLVGLPGDGVLRADAPLRDARRISWRWWTASTSGASA